MIQIVSTVGTSLFTNYMRKDVKNGFDIANKRYKEIAKEIEDLLLKPASKYDENNRKIKNIKEIIKTNWFTGIHRAENKQWEFEENALNTHASAEIKSLLALSQQDRYKNKDLAVYLIATDTILSRLAAELIKEWFDKYNGKNKPEITVNFNPERDICKSLQVTDSELFEREGIPNLINLCDRIVAGNFTNVIINITGGYKATLPYLTIYGQVNNIPLYYIFEDTDSLIHIPQAPIDIKWSLFEKYWDKFALLDNGEIGKTTDFTFEFLDEAKGCLEISDNDVVLNPLGWILWSKYKSNYFLFMAPDDVYSEIQNQKDIQRIIRGKFSNDFHRKSKTEIKQDHYVFDDGNNNNRIYYFEEGGLIYIYKTFENEEKAKKYIDEKFDKNEIIRSSKTRKVEVDNV